MTQEASIPSGSAEQFTLKLPEPEISSETPWNDDALDRAQIAGRLTNLIWDQSAPFTVSIDGYWGTGKTFMLKRWQKDLEQQGFKAIYFNAWEDDFCDDPLLAILGQLYDYFKEGTFKSLVSDIVNIGLSLIKQNALSVLEKHTGLTLKPEGDGQGQDLFAEYLSQRASKDKLKEHLRKLSASVRQESTHPVVFIIDELDRCRPTFAIELLERVKHIFDVPGIVFVFGINRDELCSSLKSIYGNIDAGVYLRRFFDFEFILPEVDAEQFARHLMQKFQLGEHFISLSEAARTDQHQVDYGVLQTFFPRIWRGFSLSLRDIDYCVRLLSLIGRNLQPRFHMYPWLLGILVPLKLKNPSLYLRLIQDRALPGEVMDYVDEIVGGQGLDSQSREALNRVEAFLYLDNRRGQRPLVKQQLEMLSNLNVPTDPEYLSRRAMNSAYQELLPILSAIDRELGLTIPDDLIGYAAGLIDLHQGMVRR